MPTPYPLNAWYAAAWDVDLKHALFPRTICGKHVVVYRQADGQVTALEDACWHRLVPLSKGRLEGDMIGDPRGIDAKDAAHRFTRQHAAVAHQLIAGAVEEDHIEGVFVDSRVLAADRLREFGQSAARHHTPASVMKVGNSSSGSSTRIV